VTSSDLALTGAGDVVVEGDAVVRAEPEVYRLLPLPHRPASAGERTWVSTLNDLEDDVTYMEQVLVAPSEDLLVALGQTWSPPMSLGPIPDDLRERAARLLQRQLAVAESLVEQITKSKRQREVAERMSHGADRPAAAFVDRAI
jgi:hypothetical protein